MYIHDRIDLVSFNYKFIAWKKQECNLWKNFLFFKLYCHPLNPTPLFCIEHVPVYNISYFSITSEELLKPTIYINKIILYTLNYNSGNFYDRTSRVHLLKIRVKGWGWSRVLPDLEFRTKPFKRIPQIVYIPRTCIPLRQTVRVPSSYARGYSNVFFQIYFYVFLQKQIICVLVLSSTRRQFLI